eukprot:1644019-Ditylum_brightwellii.AAC.1
MANSSSSSSSSRSGENNNVNGFDNTKKEINANNIKTSSTTKKRAINILWDVKPKSSATLKIVGSRLFGTIILFC